MGADGDRVAAALDAAGAPHARVTEDVFALTLRGERKHSIPAILVVRDRTLVIESFFMRAPVENHAAAYRMLLQRNARAQAVHFALGESGDVYLVGQMPLATVNDDAIDRLLGEILVTADEMFDAAIAVGFATYLARDLAWRERSAPQ